MNSLIEENALFSQSVADDRLYSPKGRGLFFSPSISYTIPSIGTKPTKWNAFPCLLAD